MWGKKRRSLYSWGKIAKERELKRDCWGHEKVN